MQTLSSSDVWPSERLAAILPTLLQCPNTHRSPQLLGCIPNPVLHIWSHWPYAFSPLLHAKAADPAVTLASDKLLEVSGDVTVKSNAAGLIIIIIIIYIYMQ